MDIQFSTTYWKRNPANKLIIFSIQTMPQHVRIFLIDVVVAKQFKFEYQYWMESDTGAEAKAPR